MQIFITDNRYAPGSSHSDLPYDALAAYSARWLDRGSGVPADVLPDRQGIAWDHDQYKVILLGELNQHRASHEVPKRSLGIDVGDRWFERSHCRPRSSLSSVARMPLPCRCRCCRRMTIACASALRMLVRFPAGTKPRDSGQIARVSWIT